MVAWGTGHFLFVYMNNITVVTESMLILVPGMIFKTKPRIKLSRKTYNETPVGHFYTFTCCFQDWVNWRWHEKSW